MNNYFEISAVSIVGGKGERLRPFTINKPKAMLPVGLEKKPMLEFTISPWIKLGLKKFIFCTGYKGDAIEEYFGNGKKLGIEIKYSKEGGKLETGGAIKNAIIEKKLSTEQPIIIFYCDDLVRLNVKNLIETHRKNVENGFKATLVAASKFRTHYGILEIESLDSKINKVISFKEKPLIDKHTNVGIYCLEPEVLQLINKHEVPFKFERAILPELVDRGWLSVFEISWNDWIPVNTDKDYEEILKINLTEFYSKV